MAEFRRPHHRAVAAVLRSLDPDFLSAAQCYFGGGTRIALLLDEFRESRDIDFLCANRAGFRLLRETVTSDSLGAIARRPLTLLREIRADRDGIRTFVEQGGLRIKVEIIFEARIDLAGALDQRLGVPALDLQHLTAEKFLANADRGLDESTRARDVIDLAFLAARHRAAALLPGLELAESAYGLAIKRHLGLVLDRFAAERRYASSCAASLGIEDLQTLRKGVAALRSLLAPTARAKPSVKRVRRGG